MTASNDTTIPPLKRCSKCGEEKPATPEYFNRCSRVKSGLKAECRECQRAYSQREETRERRRDLYKQNAAHHNKKRLDHYHRNRQKYIELKRASYHQNKERLVEQRRASYQRNKENIKARVRAWVKLNAEHRAEYQRDYREKHVEKRTEYLREYARKNPHIGRNSWHRYRARKLALPFNWTPQDWQHCLDYWNHKCAACGNSLVDIRHADHWIPLNYKGADNPGTVPDNMICLCQTCNSSKCDTMPDDWLIRKFGTDKAAEILKRIQAYFDSL